MKLLNLLAVAALCAGCGKGPAADNAATGDTSVTGSAAAEPAGAGAKPDLSLIHISEPTRH